MQPCPGGLIAAVESRRRGRSHIMQDDNKIPWMYSFLVAALANWGFWPCHVLAACKDLGEMGWVCTVQPSVLCSFVCCWWINWPKTSTWQHIWEKGISHLSDIFLGLEPLSGNCGCLLGDWLSDCLLWTSSIREGIPVHCNTAECQLFPAGNMWHINRAQRNMKCTGNI